MEIQITTNSGQKFVMKGEELADGFVDYAKAEPANVPAVKAHQWGTVLENFLATYEEETATDV